MKKLSIRYLSWLFAAMILLINTSHSAELNPDVLIPKSNQCHAIYFPENGKFLIPCVDYGTTGDIQSYTATLEQSSIADPLQFMVKEWSLIPYDTDMGADFACRAAYLPEDNKLLLPCVDVVNPPEQTESFHQVVMEQVSSNFVEVPQWKVTSVDGIDVEEFSRKQSRRAEASPVCTSGRANVTYNGLINIACNSTSCQWCNLKSKQCGGILYNGTTSIGDVSINCVNGKCKSNIKIPQLDIPWLSELKIPGNNFSCQSNQTNTVTSPCNYTISPTSADILATGQKNSTISIITTRTDCAWKVTSNVKWITLNVSSGNGTTKISYDVAVNTSNGMRNGIITVADKHFYVTQKAATNPVTLPNKPSNLSINPLSSSSIKLAWTDNSIPIFSESYNNTFQIGENNEQEI
ncbi:BACON domain-containing protein [Thioflexithrix psekupsensis]|uniref:BACON domain-containing protein n=1 Tax=Thioflexithrix psekupsensis TaxID=1570016 RepID=A0A251XBC7_9GAMM|nr:BACON domain-containing protein [Thioflexithrix psekupsensis]OUD15376.1 hypothetical protein TPSD3_02275 [Thioflexithrix psekupsensis]